MSSIKKLAGETAIYGFPTIIGRAIGFLLVPFYTSPKVLSVEEFGIYGEVYGYVAFLYIIYTYGMETTFFRFINKYDDRWKEVYNNIITLLSITSLLFSGLLIFNASAITRWLEIPGKEIIVNILALVLLVDTISSIPFALLRHQKKAKKFAAIKFTNIILSVSLNLFFLVFCKQVFLGNFLPVLKPYISYVYSPKYNLEYVFIANLIANGSYLFFLFKELSIARFALNKAWIKPLLQYGIPVGLMGIATSINDKFNLVLFPKLLPNDFYPDLNAKEANGVLNGALKLAMIMTLCIQAFKYAAEPFFFTQAKSKGAKASYANVFYYFVLFGSLMILGVSLNLDIIKIPILRDQTYWRGVELVPILLTANFFLGLAYNFSVWYKVTDKTQFGTYIATAGAIITLAGNFWAVPRFGYHGTAWVIFIAYFFIMTSTYLTGQRHYKVDYNVLRAFLWFSTSIVLTIIGLNLPISSFVALQGVKELIILVYIGLIYWFEIKNKFAKQNNS